MTNNQSSLHHIVQVTLLSLPWIIHVKKGGTHLREHGFCWVAENKKRPVKHREVP